MLLYMLHPRMMMGSRHKLVILQTSYLTVMQLTNLRVVHQILVVIARTSSGTP